MDESVQYNFDVWSQTHDPVFSELCKQSRLPEKWISYKKNKKTLYADSIVKPINRYVEALYPSPKLISMVDGTIRLRQYNHAEFFLLEKIPGNFYNLDRPWMRQYYKTKEFPEKVDGCFPETYKFYTPWVIDSNIKVRYEQPQADSPFLIYTKTIERSEIKPEQEYVEPDFVPFKFKRTGSHMVNDRFGKIKLGTPLFDIVFEGNGIIIDRLKEQYE